MNRPWCIWLRAVVPNKSNIVTKRGQVNVVHVSSFQGNRKFSRIKAKYGERVTCNHVAYSLSLF